MKKILSILYIILIVGLTFILVPVYQVKGSVDFLKNKRELLESSDFDLMSGTTLAFRNNGTSLYIDKKPLFSEHYTMVKDAEVVYNFNLNFYSVLEHKGKKNKSGMYVIIDKISINNGEDLIMDDEDRHIIKFQMFFERPFNINNNDRSESEDVFIPLYDGKSGVLFFDQTFLKDHNGYIEIDKILISVMNKSETVINLLTLTRDGYEGKIEKDVFSDVNRDISDLTGENIDLLSRTDLDSLESNPELYYNKGLARTFKTKYNYFIYFIIIWVLIVFVTTYFLFAHKYVKIKLDYKKQLKKEEFNKMVKSMKAEDKQ